MKKLISGLTMLVAFFTATQAVSQEKRTLDFYIEHAYENNNDLAIQNAVVDLRESQNAENWKNHYLPSLTTWFSVASDAEVIFNYFFSDSVFSQKYAANISASYTILDVTRIFDRKKYKNNIEIAENNRDIFSGLLERLVAVDYIEGVRLQEQIKLKQDRKQLLFDDYQNLLDLDSAFSELTKPLFDIKIQDVDLSIDENERSLRYALRKLNVWADLSYRDIDVILSDELLLPIFKVDNEFEHQERVIKKATELQAENSYLLMDNKKLDKKIAIWSWFPKLALSGGKYVNFENDYNAIDMRAVASMNIGSLYNLNDNIEQAKLNIEIYQEELSKKENNIANMVIQDYENLKYSYEKTLNLINLTRIKEVSYKLAFEELKQDRSLENLDRYFEKVKDFSETRESLVTSVAQTMKYDYMYRANTAEYNVPLEDLAKPTN